jgi:tetratricopeptide (TPR) repeat protein
MKSFKLRTLLRNNYSKILFLIIFCIHGPHSFAQKGENEASYITYTLSPIDSLIEISEYDKAESLIDNTLNTFSFRKNSEEQISFEFRIAKNYYQQGNKEKAMELLLVGLDKLKSSPFSSLNFDYADMLSKIFADSQNFDKAIYYNKIALQKSYLTKDTVGITKSLIRMGGFYYAKNEEDSAKIFFKKVTYIPVTPNTIVRIANAHNNLGVIAQNNDNFDLAKHRFRQALDLKLNQNDIVGVSSLNVNLGNLHHFEEEYDKAINRYLNAFEQIKNDTTSRVLHLKSII